MEKYIRLINLRIFTGLGVNPKQLRDEQKKIIQKRIEHHASSPKLKDAQMAAFCYMYHCYDLSEAVKQYEIDAHKKINQQSLMKNANRAKEKICKWALNDSVIRNCIKNANSK